MAAVDKGIVTMWSAIELHTWGDGELRTQEAKIGTVRHIGTASLLDAWKGISDNDTVELFKIAYSGKSALYMADYELSLLTDVA